MKLARLQVERFQCIESASVDFGPGLNVFYGPNDLGKSSLAWAIRAVLLLQHNSAAHARFVSWHGGGEPRVALTLQDDENRYWRITKAFGSGSTGRSMLESSKNGQTYTAEASGREVDDRLRALLRWGLHRPGGRGTPHGMPASFLTQVLLADQDDVRKILFGSSLAKDEDESGRARLSEALGALAQDPLFRRVLEEAQEHVDRAFTPNGKKKRSAGSPFVDIAKKLEELQQQRDALGEQLRKSELAEAKIAELNSRRDATALERDAARVALEDATARLATCRRRDEIATQIAEHGARIDGVARWQKQLEDEHAEATRLEADVAVHATQLAAIAGQVNAAEAEVETSREALDELSRGATTLDRMIEQLAERETSALEADREAQRNVQNAETVLRNATASAFATREAAASLAGATREARRAEETSTAAGAAEEDARVAHEAARQRLRDVTGGDQARARELTRQRLENERLQLASRRQELERALERVAAIATEHREIAALREQCTELADLLLRNREVAASEQRAIGGFDEELAFARRLEQYGRFREAAAALEAARALVSAADREHARAAGLRSESAALRAKVPCDLPSSEMLEALQRLHQELELAQARLGAVSVTIKPRRPLAVQLTKDGAVEAPCTIEQPVSLSGERELTIAIEELVEFEITGGDAATRAEVSRLKDLWRREGTTVLQAAGVDTVAQLAARRAEANSAMTDADVLEREARSAEELAARQRPTNLDELVRAYADCEVELAGSHLADLAHRFEALGSGWAQAIRRRVDDLQRELARTRTQAEERSGQAARAEAQLEARRSELTTKERALAEQAAALGDPWTDVRARCGDEIARIDDDRSTLERALDELAGNSSGEEARVREGARAAEQALAGARQPREHAAVEAQRTRDAVVAARTRLETARADAAALDAAGVWITALTAEIPELSLDGWQAAVERARETRDLQRRALAETAEQLHELRQRRSRALEEARERVAGVQQRIVAVRQQLEGRRELERTARDRLVAVNAEVAELRVQLAGTDVQRSRSAIVDLQAALDALPNAGWVDASQVERHAQRVDELTKQLRDIDDERHKAHGALEHVGGAVVREQIRELDQAIEQRRQRRLSIEREYDAWQLLAETLREAEKGQSQHLGRQLGVPVSRRFQQLTGGRYGALELNAHLEAEGFHAVGELRDISALSAGTQDQLATLFRLCIAEQLKSTIVLDDHLSHSDGERVAWFNEALRSAAQQLQIILITCRPGDVLAADELPASGDAFRVAAAGLTRAIDLSRIIRRYGATPPTTATMSLAGTRS